MSGIKHYFLHADLDAFFASVEQLDHPEYRGKPVIVGGKPEDKRSVVSTASYEARVFGVHSAMPVAKAYQLCPQGIYVHGRMKRYSELSYQIMNIFKDFSPDVQQMSIDEAFIDITGTEKLFGPPKETAMKIKQRVKAETGLTVSIGLAPTKYLAKLASDMKKPDGFYYIDEGTEQEFMLNLPLRKVWGIGDKTYEALKANGLKTTRDIFEKTPEALTFMFGQNTGNFLYNVVRGIDVVNFDRKAKSHSISNETTFPVDISNIYTIETTILELCHSVIFRLLKENGFSRTVMVKIRYEDFSTVSIQQTFSYSVLTLDTLYSAAKELFERKYERGRGVRLIGIALENIENSERPYQPSLFDDGSEKKQKVEKAILGLEKKHPEIKIHKARMLENLGKGTKVLIVAALLSLFNLWLPFESLLAAQEKNWEINGYWKGDLEGTIDSTFGFGNPFGLSAQPPVFKQEVDLSALIHITPDLFFSMEFLDEFKNNTYTFGYNGRKYLNLLTFSNRGITFPSEYSSQSIGYGVTGGQNQAPGVMLHFTDYENNNWSGDFLLRYDMTETKTATFHGKNKVSDSLIKAENYARSQAFVIPSDVISEIKNVYIQSEGGNYKDNHGISYEKLTPADFIILESQKLLILSEEAVLLGPKKTVPYILITFITPVDCDKLLSDTGSYDNASTFAGKIQQFFNSSSDYTINLSQYSSLNATDITCNIDDTKAFIIQAPETFSPYLCSNLYKLSDYKDNSDYLVTDRYSGTQNPFYNVTGFPYSFGETNFAIISNSKNTEVTPLLPEYRFPFADRYPLLYLNNTTDFPLIITERSYSPVKEYDIGKRASAGTVQVFINGILEPGAFYNSDTGFVTLPYEVGELDKVYITYNEESNNISNGAFTTAIGYIYNFTQQLKLDLSFTGKYPYTPEKGAATTDKSYGTFSAFTTGLSFSNDNLTLNDILAAAIEDSNITDKMKTEFSSVMMNTGKGVTAAHSLPEKSSDIIDISWTIDDTTATDQERKITTTSYFTASDFSQYESINFDFAITENAEITLLLESSLEEKVLEIKLKEQLINKLVSYNKTFHTLTILLKNNSVLLDGTKPEETEYEIILNKDSVPQLQKIIVIPQIPENAEQPQGHLYVSGVYYKTNSPFFTSKNKTILKYKNNFWSAEAESTQGVSIRTDNGKRITDYVNTSVKGGTSFFGFNLSADADTAFSSFSRNSNFLKTAGHSLQTQQPAFSFLELGEAYRYSGSTSAYEKKDWVKFDFSKLNFPVSAATQIYAKNTGLIQTQNYEAQLDSDIKTDQTSFSFNSKINASQKAEKNLTSRYNYFSQWYNSSVFQFSDGKDAASRTTSFSTTLKASIPLAKLSPVFSIDFSNTHKPEDKNLFTSDIIKFSLPFSTQNNAFSINIIHKAGFEQKSSENKNYSDDLKNLFQNQTNYELFYKSIPLYSLFQKSLSTKLKQTIINGNETYATENLEYYISWRRKLFNDIKDLYIPYSASAGASRNIITTGTTTNDLYQLRLSAASTFINLFGTDSTLELFDWYKQEEYIGSVTAIYKFSPIEKAASSFVISSSELMLFYIDNSNTITINTDFSIDQKINWSFKVSSSWNRNSKNSLLLITTNALWEKSREMDFKSSVRDSANISLSRQNKINKQTYEYKRTAEVSFRDNVFMTSGAGILFGFEQNKTFRLSISYNLGIKITY